MTGFSGLAPRPTSRIRIDGSASTQRRGAQEGMWSFMGGSGDIDR